MSRRFRQTIPEGRIQGPKEIITYRLKTTQWGGSPTDPELAVLCVTDEDTDVTNAVAPGGTPAIDGDDILLVISGLTEDKLYEVNVDFTSDGQKLSTFFTLACK